MTSHALRLYVASVTLLVFFVLWAVVAAKPWASTGGRAAPDPRLVALNGRQRRLERETRIVKRQLERRWLEYRRRLRKREALIHMLERRHAAQVAAARAAAASTASTYSAPSTSGGSTAQVVTSAPQVRVVTLPPATSSGSSHP
jgi:hypothetical protein